MKWLNIYLATLISSTLLLTPFLQGCATLIPASDNRIEQWVTKKHYAKAHRSVSKSISEQKLNVTEDKALIIARQKKLADIEKLSRSYWHQIKKRTDTLVSKKQWKQAEQQLKLAINNLVNPNPAKKALQTLLSVEDKALSRLKIREAIAQGKWLSREYALQVTLKDSTQGSLLTPFTIQQLKSKQHALAADLIHYAQTAFKEKKLTTTKRCYEALNLILVPKDLKPQVAAIGKQLYQNKKHALAYQQKTLAEGLDESIKNGSLVEATQIIEKLKKLKPLPNRVLIKIEAVNCVLDYNAEFLDEKADIYYREGKVELAKSIWDYLLKLNPNSTDISIKLSRAEKVIKNVQELREAGHNASPSLPANSSLTVPAQTVPSAAITPGMSPQTLELKTPIPQP